MIIPLTELVFLQINWLTLFIIIIIYVFSFFYSFLFSFLFFGVI